MNCYFKDLIWTYQTVVKENYDTYHIILLLYKYVERVLQERVMTLDHLYLSNQY